MENSMIWNRKQAVSNLDDALLGAAISSYSEIIGEELLEYNQQIREQPQFQLSDAENFAIRKQFKRWERNKNNQKHRKIAFNIVSKVAVVFLVISICFYGTISVSAEFRKIIYNLLFNETEQYTAISFDQNDLSAFIDPELYTAWNHMYAFTWLPDGYAFSEKVEMVSNVTIIYKYESDKVISFSQSNPLSEMQLYLDTEDAQVVRIIIINDSEALLVSKNGMNMLVWRSGNTVFELTSNEIDIDTLVEIAKDIRIIR